MILTLLALWTTLVGFLATLSILRWKPRRAIPKAWYPGITILKPIRGLEPELETNLHSFFNLEGKIPFEIIFCVKNPDDLCVPIINKLKELHPKIDAKLFTNAPDLGRNPKISNMHYAWERAKYDLILISDSNVRVEPHYLEMLLAERQQGGGLVTQVVYGAGGKTLGGHLDVIHLNTFYLKATAFLNIFGFSCVLGKCMLFSRQQFERLGGLFSVRNYLAEDLVAGEMMKEAGYTVRIAPELLRQTTIMSNFKSYWNRHVRWARLRKCHFFGAYLVEPLFFESLWPILLMIFAQNEMELFLGVGCFGAQILCNILLHVYKFKDAETWKSFPYFLVKDLIAPFLWFAGLVSNKVIWRGQALHLRFGGKLGTKYLKSARIRRLQARMQVRRTFSV
jgi:ceramide glucosyltransferase